MNECMLSPKHSECIKNITEHSKLHKIIVMFHGCHKRNKLGSCFIRILQGLTTTLRRGETQRHRGERQDKLGKVQDLQLGWSIKSKKGESERHGNKVRQGQSLKEGPWCKEFNVFLELMGITDGFLNKNYMVQCFREITQVYN